MADEPENPMQPVVDQLQSLIDRRVVPALESTAGLTTALMTILKKLDANGVLPASEAKVAIDEAHADLTAENRASGQGLVLRQVSQFLAALISPPRVQ